MSEDLNGVEPLYSAFQRIHKESYHPGPPPPIPEGEGHPPSLQNFSEKVNTNGGGRKKKHNQ
jgi:hypothetical protein